jgi:hypothetical protein
MHTALSSHALEGIEAAPVDMVVQGDQAKTVELDRGRCHRSVKLRTTSLEARQPVQLVNLIPFRGEDPLPRTCSLASVIMDLLSLDVVVGRGHDRGSPSV